MIPLIAAHPIQDRVFRFISNKSASTNYSVTRGCLLNLLVYLENTTGSNAYRIIQSIKVNRLRVWCFIAPGATTAGLLNAEVEWYGGGATNRRISSMGNATAPCFLDSRPPVGSLAGFWSSQADVTLPESQQLFQVSQDNAGYNTQSTLVLDLHVSYTLTDPVTKQLAIGVFGGSAHQLSYNYLDNTVVGGTGSGSMYLSPEGIDGTGVQAYG
jgi:hypothetical protein